MSPVDVVIAIVSYKSAALTIECLRSIDAEQFTPGVRIRTIVVDNASGDTPEIARSIAANSWSSWVTLITAPKNGGFGYGNNLAFRHAHDKGRPDYFHLLNPDTFLRKGAIGALVRFLEEHSQVGIVGGSFENDDGSEWPIAFRFPSILSEIEGGFKFGLVTQILRPWVVAVEMAPRPQPIDWVPGASMMFRCAVLDAIGGFDENYFLYFEETDFCYRAKRAGFSTWYVPESRVMHMGGQSTKVTERNVALKRLPRYWFESRRRYFVISYGSAYAAAVDFAALLAYSAGSFKRILQRKKDHLVPHFLRDLAHNSTLWSRNRRIAATEPHIPNFREKADVASTAIPVCIQLHHHIPHLERTGC
jgi:N-acetylglucosaminyl-diphospho-decaprenol L-rhamnosyltransferase